MSAPKNTPLSRITTIDEADQRAEPLGKIDFWLPGRSNQEAVALELPVAWLRQQRCPEHPAMVTLRGWGFTHHRAKWARVRLPSGATGWKPAVMFKCVQNHLWEVVLP